MYLISTVYVVYYTMHFKLCIINIYIESLYIIWSWVTRLSVSVLQSNWKCHKTMKRCYHTYVGWFTERAADHNLKTAKSENSLVCAGKLFFIQLCGHSWPKIDCVSFTPSQSCIDQELKMLLKFFFQIVSLFLLAVIRRENIFKVDCDKTCTRTMNKAEWSHQDLCL